MQRFELEAWLGPALEEMTAEQVEVFAGLVEQIGERYRGRDHGQHPDEEAMAGAMSGALAVMLGDDTVVSLAADWFAVKTRERDAMARLTGGIIASRAAGRSELSIAAETGLNRGTVRKAVGK